MDKRQKLLEQLEKYRGKKGLLARELGAAGLIALAELCEHSPTTAAKFLGYADGSYIRHLWLNLGLPIRKRNWAETRDGVSQTIDGLSVEQWEEIWKAQTMNVELAPIFEWRIKPNSEYGILVLVGDLHYCNPCVDLARWLKLRDWIAENRDVRWIGMGDFLDCPTAGSPGGTAEQVVPFNVAFSILKRHLEPIAKQCLLLLQGNHEGRLQKDLQLRLCPIQMLAEQLGVHYGGRGTHLRIKIKAGRKEQTYDGFVHHGYGSARTAGAQISKLIQTLQWNIIDFVGMAHTHTQILTEPVRKYLVEYDNGYVRVEQRRIPLIMTGCYLQHRRDSYTQQSGFAPGSLGASAIHLYATHKSVHGRI